MSINVNHKSILVRLFIISGLFISIYSGVLLSILAILELNIPDTLPHLTWVSSSFLLTLNIFIIGLGILIGSLIYNRLSPTDTSFENLKERVFKKNIKRFRIIFKTGNFIGALIASYVFGYFISLLILNNHFYFSAPEIAELFLNPLVFCVLFFLLGIFIFFIGLYFIRNLGIKHESDNEKVIPRFLSIGNRILSSVGIVQSILLVFPLVMGISWIFMDPAFIPPFYPPDPYTWEYIGFILGILSILIFIFIYCIQYYIRINWYIKKHREIKRLKLSNRKKFIFPILAIIGIIITFFPIPYLGIAYSLSYIITVSLPIGYWDINTITLCLIFFAVFLLVGLTVILSPRRIYEI
ncbi:MAG: hypothetical protein ACFE9S_02395 [Candidatus Hermodarchaeota archaeon]